MLAATLVTFLPGCSTLVDDMASTSPIAARVLKGTSTWYDRRNATFPTVAQNERPDVSTIQATMASKPTPAPAIPNLQTPATPDAYQAKPAQQATRNSVAEIDVAIRNAGAADTSTRLAPQNIALSDGLIKAYTHYAHFQYREAIEQSVRVFGDEQIRSDEKALALIIAAASAYVLGQHEKCLDFLLMSVETDAHVLPNPNVFPGDVCRMHRAARANST